MESSNAGWLITYFFAGPVAQVGEAAAFAAEREILVSHGIGWLPANRTFPNHGSFARAETEYYRELRIGKERAFQAAPESADAIVNGPGRSEFESRAR